jgi:hypothetical protein
LFEFRSQLGYEHVGIGQAVENFGGDRLSQWESDEKRVSKNNSSSGAQL